MSGDRAKRACIKHYGIMCFVCNFDFEELYGEIGQGFIIVHHLKPISEQGDTKINPAVDLRPVCSNCHSMLHRRKTVLSINELQKIVETKCK